MKDAIIMKSQPVERMATLRISEDEIPKKYALLEKLLKILYTEDEINSVLLGYLCKILSTLIDSRKSKIWEYFMKYRTHFDKLILHSENLQITELLQKLMKDPSYETPDPQFIKERKQILENLIKMPIKGWNVIIPLISLKVEIRFFNEQKNIDFIFSHICKGNSTVIQSGLKLLSELIEINSINENQYCALELFKDQQMEMSEKYDLSGLFQSAADNLEFLKNILIKNSESFGNIKLAIIEWILLLANQNNKIIMENMIENEIPIILLDLMKKYYTHSLFHIRANKIIENILKYEHPEKTDFILNFLIKTQFPILLISSFNFAKKGFIFKNTKFLNKQYMVFITSICNLLVEITEKQPKIQEFVQNIISWKTFCDTELSEINKKQNTKIGGNCMQPRRFGTFGISSLTPEENKDSRTASEALKENECELDLKKPKIYKKEAENIEENNDEIENNKNNEEIIILEQNITENNNQDHSNN